MIFNFVSFMSRILLFFVIIAALTASNCGNSPKHVADDNLLSQRDTGTAVISFTGYEHDFGKVAEGEKVGYTFKFKNTGTGNLIINSATTTCGCTVPKYSTKPIASGKNGEMEVIFDTSGRRGIQTKTITVRSNANTPVVILRIIAEVIQ
jgi:hypothetical protein